MFLTHASTNPGVVTLNASGSLGPTMLLLTTVACRAITMAPGSVAVVVVVVVVIVSCTRVETQWCHAVPSAALVEDDDETLLVLLSDDDDATWLMTSATNWN